MLSRFLCSCCPANGFTNYPEALAKIPYIKYMMNTIFITALSVLGSMFATPMVAYSLARIKWAGSKVISSLIMATMMIPYTVTMIPLYRIWSKLVLPTPICR